jgi:hypothetical protein
MYLEGLGEMEAGEGDEVDTQLLGWLQRSAFLRSKGQQGSLSVAGDVGVIPLV